MKLKDKISNKKIKEAILDAIYFITYEEIKLPKGILNFDKFNFCLKDEDGENSFEININIDKSKDMTIRHGKPIIVSSYKWLENDVNYLTITFYNEENESYDHIIYVDKWFKSALLDGRDLNLVIKKFDKEYKFIHNQDLYLSYLKKSASKEYLKIIKDYFEINIFNMLSEDEIKSIKKQL